MALQARRLRNVTVEIAVVGAHLKGQPLNHELVDRGARFGRATATSPCYRLFALPTAPPKPGLVRVPPDDPQAGAVEVEVWSLDAAAFGSFVAGVPAPLSIGRVSLMDGGTVSGFLCESLATAGALDITHFGGWRSYLASGGAPG
jgi:allophanate hydrolase